MRRSFALLIILVVALSLLFLISCDCKHEAQKIEGKASTCTESGLTDGEKCSICGEILKAQVTIPASGHNYENCICTGCNDEKHSEDCICAVCGTGAHNFSGCVCTVCGYDIHEYENCICTGCNDEKHSGDCICAVCGTGAHNFSGCVCTVCGYDIHEYENSICTVCGLENPKEALLYKLSDDGEYYIVTGKGSRTGDVLIIPRFHDGKPVKKITGEAFIGNSTIKKVIIPGTITHISGRAFYNCSELEEIVFSEGTTYIGYETFAYCEKIKKIELPNSLVTMEYGAFYGCQNLEEVHTGNGLEKISSSALRSCNLKKLYVGTGIKEIDDIEYYGLQIHIASLEAWEGIVYSDRQILELMGYSVYVNGECVYETENQL